MTARPRDALLALYMGLLFALFGCVGAIASWGAYRTDTEIVRHGQRADGHITAKRILFSADGDSDYTVAYWFSLPGGQRVEAVRAVPRSLWDTLDADTTLVVLYAPGHPARNFPAGAGVTAVGVTVFVFALSLVFIVAGSMLIMGYFRTRRARP